MPNILCSLAHTNTWKKIISLQQQNQWNHESYFVIIQAISKIMQIMQIILFVLNKMNWVSWWWWWCMLDVKRKRIKKAYIGDLCVPLDWQKFSVCCWLFFILSIFEQMLIFASRIKDFSVITVTIFCFWQDNKIDLVALGWKYILQNMFYFE